MAEKYGWRPQPRRKVRRRKPQRSVGKAITRAHKKTPVRFPKPKPAPRRPKAAPYSMLDRVDRKKGRTVPVRKTPVRKLDRQTKRFRRKVKQKRSVGRAISRAGKRRAFRLANALDTDTKVLGFNLEAELEGRGLAAKGSKFLGDALASEYGTEQNLRESSLLPKRLKRIGQAGTRELAQLPAAIPAAVYGVGAGAAEAARGRPQRSKEQWRQLKKHDPLFLAAQGKFKQAAKEAEKAPVGTALTVSGVGKATSLAGGKAARVDTRREPRRAPGTRMAVPRRYPKGLAGNKAARANEKRKVRKAKAGYARARELRERGERDEAASVTAKAVEQDPRVMSEPELRTRQDYREGLAEARRRVHRSKAVKKADTALAKDGAEAQLLIAQGIIKPTRQSAQGYLRDLESEARKDTLSPARKVTNTRLRRQLRKMDSDDTDFKALGEKAGEYAKVVNPLQAKLVKKRILPVGQAKKAKLTPYAVRDMGARDVEDVGLVLDRNVSKAQELKAEVRAVRSDRDLTPREQATKVDGLRAGLQALVVTPNQIKTHMKKTGRDPADVAYVTQAPGQRGGKNFYMNWNEPKGLSTKRRTGEATRKGTFDVDREVGRENVARMQSLLDAADEYKEFVKEAGNRPSGKKVKAYKDHAAAMEAKRDFEASGHPYPLRAIPLTPQFGRKEQADSLLDQANADASTMEGVTKSVARAFDGEGDDSGRWVLVPDASADQAAKHTRTLDPTASGKAARLGLQQFRAAVLTTAPTWPTGNVIEGVSRRGIARAGPVSGKLSADTLRKLEDVDPFAAEQLKTWIGKGHIGSQELRQVHTTAEQFKGTKWAKAARAMATARRTKGPKQVADGWSAYTRFIFDKNGIVEAHLKQAMLGRYIKDQLLPPGAIRDWNKAVEQAARGLTNTNEQVAAVKWLDRAYGKYNNWGPDAKRIIGTYTPFAAWTMNALKFIYAVLPRDHPILTAGLVEAEKATREWREAEGMEVVSNFLKAGVPLGGSLRNIGRYTPFGIMADPVESIGGLLLPNISGAWLATKGLDWKGDPIKEDTDLKFGSKRADDVSTGARVEEGAKSLLGAMVPLFGQVKRGSEKEGNVGEKALQVLNPFRAFEKGNPKLQKAFDDRDKLQLELDKLPPLTELTKGSPRWKQRRRLLDRKEALRGRINKESKGKWGKKPGGGRKVKRANPYGGSSSGGGGGSNPYSAPAPSGSTANPY